MALNNTSSNTMNVESWIGSDESGKGDYFGPLVVASVYVNAQIAQNLIDLGVKDCKKVTDKKAIEFAAKIKNTTFFDVVVIGNKKYNELYNKFNNLNTMLAWAHARAIENLLNKKECNYALVDQFADQNVIKKSLMSKGKDIQLMQRHKAEDDIAVAAASILARAEFVNRLAKMSIQYDLELPKGASSKVLDQAKLYVKKYGPNALDNVAKLHFKSTQKILANS